MANETNSLPSKFSLGGKVALITGGAGLLGRAHAEALMLLGAKVILTDINQEDLKENHSSKKPSISRRSFFVGRPNPF